MLTVQGLHVSYGRAQVLFGVDLEAPAGALVCVMGRNGVGQDHPAQRRHGRAAGRAPARSPSTGGTSRG